FATRPPVKATSSACLPRSDARAPPDTQATRSWHRRDTPLRVPFRKGGRAPPWGKLDRRRLDRRRLPRRSRRATPNVRKPDEVGDRRVSAVVDTLTLGAEEAIGLVERKEVSPAELHAAYRAAIDERDGELHAFLRTADYDGGTGIPIALKDVI